MRGCCRGQNTMGVDGCRGFHARVTGGGGGGGGEGGGRGGGVGGGGGGVFEGGVVVVGGWVREGVGACRGDVGSGDVTADSAVVWSATERGARMLLEWDTADSFKNAKRVVGPDAVSRTGFTAKMELTGLPADTRVYYRVVFENIDDFSMSEPV